MRSGGQCIGSPAERRSHRKLFRLTLRRLRATEGDGLPPAWLFEFECLAGVFVDGRWTSRWSLLARRVSSLRLCADFADEPTLLNGACSAIGGELTWRLAVDRRRAIARKGERTAPRSADYSGLRLVK